MTDSICKDRAPICKMITMEDGHQVCFKNCPKMKKIREEFDKNALNMGKLGWRLLEIYRDDPNFKILEVSASKSFTVSECHKYYFLNEQMIARRRCSQSAYFLFLKDCIPPQIINSGFYLPTEQEVEKKYEEDMRKKGFPRLNDPKYREIYY